MSKLLSFFEITLRPLVLPADATDDIVVEEVSRAQYERTVDGRVLSALVGHTVGFGNADSSELSRCVGGAGPGDSFYQHVSTGLTDHHLPLH